MSFYIGISVQEEHLQVAILKKEGKGVSIDSLHTLLLSDVKELYTLFSLQKKTKVISGLKGSEVLVRKFTLPFSKKRQIRKALPFQIESILPNGTDVIATQVKTKNPTLSVITLFSSTRAKLRVYLEKLEELGIQADQVSCEVAALVRFAHFVFPLEKKVLLLDFRKEGVTFSAIEQGELLFSQTLSLEPPLLLIERLKIFLQHKGLEEKEFCWLCTGDDIPRVTENIEGKKLVTPLAKEAVSIGLALDGALQDGTQIQFCEGALIPSFMAKKRKKALFVYAIACLSCAACLFFGGKLCIYQKSKHISETIHHYFPHQTKELSVNALQELLAHWEGSLKGKKSPLPLSPTVPKVSEVLSFLSAHPSLASELGEPKEGVEIQEFSYKLTKHPTLLEMKVPYVATVEVGLKSPSKKVAKEFHESLLKTDQIVNRKKDVKWQEEGSFYRASFELSKKVSP